MKNLVLCIVVSLMSTLFSAPTKSIIGAKNSVSFTEDPHRLPTEYVVDGLVAYFDALENEDWGVYNPVPSFWKDLTGNGFDLPLDGTSVVFNDGICTIPTGTTVNCWKALNDVECIEIVWRIRKTTPFVVEKVLHTGTTRGVMIRYAWIGIKQTNNKNGNSLLGQGNYDFLYGSYSFSYAYPNLCNIYLNGLKQEISYVSISTTDLDGVGITTKDVNLYISCIRIYNRALTKEEIAHNYMIDKVRFNLP